MPAQTPQTALVIGAGPAGLMAADVLSAAGVRVTVADRMPSAGRKFLMAGKSGLNLTKDEDTAACLAAYGDAPAVLRDALAAFGPAQVMAWARDLGQPLFTGSTGRVFPVAMKASPLLRAWLARLAARDVRIATRWTWTGWAGAAATFDTPTGPQAVTADVTILALGGASWRRLGSDGAWAAQLADTAPFQPANCGFRVAWSDHMAPFFGQPVKATALTAGGLASRGEWVVTRDGIEGGGIYAMSRVVRDGAPLHVDLLPDMTADRISQRVAAKGKKASLSQVLKSGLRLSPVKIALFQELTRRAGVDVAERLTQTLKSLPLIHDGPAPLDRAISTAGGLRFKALSGLMLHDRPGTFACGEMLDWEAPTGGYLITASLATGRAAALAALSYRPDGTP